MRGNVRLTVRSTVTAGLAGLAMLAAAPALAAGPALAASAVPAGRTAPAPAGTGAFSTWTAARRAAGYAPYVPARTAGLSRSYKILVSRCAPGYDIFAQWGGKTTYLSLYQNNTGRACASIGPARFIRTYRAGRQSYALYGFCGRAGQPPCSSTKAVLVLVWAAGGRYYVAYSRGEAAGTLVTFAASIRRY